MYTEKNQHLKEEIDKKVTELQQTVRTVNKLEKERTLLKMEIQNYSVTLQHTRTELKEKKMEIERLYKQISVGYSNFFFCIKATTVRFSSSILC